MGEVRVCPGAPSARGRGACARPGAGRVARSLTPSSRRRLGARPTPCQARSPFGLCVHAGGCAFRARPAACCGFSGDTAGCEAPLLRASPCPYAFPLGPQFPPRPRGLGAGRGERVSERLLSRWGRARPGPGLCSGCSGPVVPWLSLRPAPARVCAAESADGPGPQQMAAGVGQGACRAASEAATAAAGSRARPWAAGARCSPPVSAEVLFKTFFFSERIFG